MPEKLLELEAEWEKVAEAETLAADRLDEAEERYHASRPPIPAVLMVRARDFEVFGMFPGRPCLLSGGEGQDWYGEPATIQELRERRRRTMDHPNPNAPELDERAIARIDEITAALEAWEAACATLNEACGIPALVQAFRACGVENRKVRRDIVREPARSLQGAMVKARIAQWLHSERPEDMHRRVQARLNHESEPCAETMALLVVIDLLRLRKSHEIGLAPS